MLNPEQAAKLKARPLTHEKGEIFEGFYVETLRVNIPEPIRDPRAGTEQGRMYVPDKIFGRPEFESCLVGIGNFIVDSPSLYFTKYENARIVGFCGFLTHDNVLHSLSRIDTRSKDSFVKRNASYNHQGFVFFDQDGEFIIKFGARPVPAYRNFDALFLPNIEPGNYGSFMFRMLPALLLAAQSGIEYDCYVVSDRTAWVIDAIALSGLPSKPIFSVGDICGDTFKSLTVVNDFDAEGFLNKTVRRLIGDFVEKLVSSFAPRGHARTLYSLTAPRKIYVSRSLSALHRPYYRVMLNEREVEDKLQKSGFDIVYPESLPFTQQILTFWNASHVIGPSGSGMFNTVFAKLPVSVVDIETFHYTVRQHAKLYASCEMRYAFLFCKTDPTSTLAQVHRPYELPLEMLDEVVRWLLQQ